MFKPVVFLLSVSFLSGCAFFQSHVGKTTNSNCEAADFSKIQSKLESSHRDIIACFTKYQRTDDLNNYKNLLSSKEISIKCEPAKNSKLAEAQGPGSKKFPGLNVYTYKLIENNPTEYEKAFFHESIHWLGYQNYADVDIPSIAEMCCVEKNKASCDMFRYKGKDWTTPAYLKEFTRHLAAINQSGVGVRTALNAAIYVSRNTQKPEQVRKVLYSPLEEINAGAIKKKFRRQDIKAFAPHLGAVSQGIVLASIVDRSEDKKLKAQSSKYLERLISRFYSNPIDKEKILFFTNVGSAIEAVIFKKPEELVGSWKILRDRAEYICRDLKKNEISAVNELLGDVSSNVFELKSEIEAGTFYDIGTNWMNLCDKKAL